MNEVGYVKKARAIGAFTATAAIALLATAPVANAQYVPSAGPSVAEGAPGSGSFPGSFLVPGTNTSIKIGGYAKGDLQFDHGVSQNFVANAAGTAPVIAVLPLDGNIPGTAPAAGHGIHGVTHISAGESRFNIETRTPTGFGEFKTFIEGDFEGASGLQPGSNANGGNTFLLNSDSSAFRIRHAYGTLGGLLAGQYFSLFEDLAAAPETLDFGGALGVSGPLRQGQFRYVYNVGNGFTVGVSAETPQSFFFSTLQNGQAAFGTATSTLGQGDKIPDFVGAIIYNQGPGHVSFRGVIREIYDHGAGACSTNDVAIGQINGFGPCNGNAVTPASAGHASAVGWGLGVSGDYHVWGKDDLMFQVTGGRGIGRYLTNTGNEFGDAIVSIDGNSLDLIAEIGAMVAYQHWWTDNLRSNIEGSLLRAFIPNGFFPATVSNAAAAVTAGATGNVSTTAFNCALASCIATSAPGGSLGSINNRFLSGHLNLIWSPVPPVDLGVEYIWEQRRTVAGQTAQLNRSQVSAKFKF